MEIPDKFYPVRAASRSPLRAWAWVGALALGLCSCGPSAPPPASSYLPSVKIKIVTTTPQIAEMARHIGGEAVEVECLLEPGENPHAWLPTASDVLTIRSADVVLIHGLGLERSLLGMQPGGEPTVTRDLEVMNAGKNMIATVVTRDLLDSDLLQEKDVVDPHVWNSPRLWQKCADPVTETLVSMVSKEAAPYFESRGEEWKGGLKALDGWARERLAIIPPENRYLLVAVDTLRYFAGDYGLDYRALASPRDPDFTVKPEVLEWVSEHKVGFMQVEVGCNLEKLVPAQMQLGLQDSVQSFIHTLSLGPPGSAELSPLGGTYDTSTTEGAFQIMVLLMLKWMD